MADKIGSGEMTGAAAETLEKLEDVSEMVLEGGVEYTKFLNTPELLSKVAEKVQLPEVNSDVVKKVLDAATEVWKGVNKNTKLSNVIDTSTINSNLQSTDIKMKKNEYIKPVEGKITSDFGYRVAPTKGASTGHSGIDIGVPVGTPIKSIADGTVVSARGGMRGYGNGVFIDHGIINGKHIVSEYGHLSELSVKAGDKVAKGQVIAKSGNTGTSTGPHLHLTIRENGIPVNPKEYIKSFIE